MSERIAITGRRPAVGTTLGAFRYHDADIIGLW